SPGRREAATGNLSSTIDLVLKSANEAQGGPPRRPSSQSDEALGGRAWHCGRTGARGLTASCANSRPQSGSNPRSWVQGVAQTWLPPSRGPYSTYFECSGVSSLPV